LKDDDNKTKKPAQSLPPEVSPTVPQELSSSIEAMKEAHKTQDHIVKQQWEEKKGITEKKGKSMYKGFCQKLAKGEGPNPVLKKSKSIGGVRGKFHPSKKGKS